MSIGHTGYESWNRGCEKEDGFIDFVSPQSLQTIALFSVSSRLLGVFCTKEGRKPQFLDSQKIEEMVVKKLKLFASEVSQLKLPSSLEIKLFNVLWPIGLQMIKCLENHNECCNNYEIFSSDGSVYWTAEGTFDKFKSHVVLISNDGQEKDYLHLYQLACKYCMEENISSLWRKISTDKKETIDYVYRKYDNHIIAYWTAFLKDELPTLLSKIKCNDVCKIYDSNLSIYQNMVSLSILMGNTFAFKYFWHKLTEQERNATKEKWLDQAIGRCNRYYRFDNLKCNSFLYIMYFLLSKLDNKHQQSQVFRTHTEMVLTTLFFGWPWRLYFLPTINQMWDYLPKDIYVKIMSNISQEIKTGKTTVHLLQEIWYRSPKILKKHFLSSDQYVRYTLRKLMDADKMERVTTMVFDDASFSEEVIMLKNFDIGNFASFLEGGNLSFATNFLNLSTKSPDEVLRIKNKLLVSEKGIYAILLSLDYGHLSWKNLKYLLEWFFPLLSETIDQLKIRIRSHKFVNFCDEYTPKNKKRAFHYILNRIALKYSAHCSTSNYGSDINIEDILRGKI